MGGTPGMTKMRSKLTRRGIVKQEDARAFFTHRGYGMPRALSL